MKALLIAKQQHAHQVRVMKALAEGMRKCGTEARLTNSGPALADDDFIVTWGDKQPTQCNGAAHLILECGYINGTDRDYKANRLRFISTSWNKRGGLSDWNWHPEPSAERWNSLGIELMPWKSDGEYVLLLEQCVGDRAAPDVEKFRKLITSECARRKWPLVVRPHPISRRNQSTLAEDLAGASLAITWCSTASVEAVIAGVPTYTLGPGSITAPVTAHSLSDPPYMGDRTTWAHRLAHRQWTLDEMRDGSAWPHIQRGLKGSQEWAA